MPTYVYTCLSCELEIEERRSIAEADKPLSCPICGETCKRVVVVSFAIGGARQSAASAGTGADTAPASSAPHRAGCPCCVPASRFFKD